MKLFTAKKFGVGVNVVTSSVYSDSVTAFSHSEILYFNRTNKTYKLPYFLFEFVLLISVAAKAAAVLFKESLKLISVVLEIAPRGVLFLLSLINFVVLRFYLSSTEWPMKSKDEDDNLDLYSDYLPMFSLYVQQNHD